MTNNDKQLDASKEMLINKPDADGWISWSGGECPVSCSETLVDCKRADGDEYDEYPAKCIYWHGVGEADSIIAYRLHKPEDDQPVWNGEGRPPVGLDIIVTPHNNLWGFSSVDDFTGKVVAYDDDEFWFKLSNGVKIASRIDKVDFHPIRTEAERKREDIIDELVSVFISHHGNPKGAEGYRSIAAKLYDKVISKKLEAPDGH